MLTFNAILRYEKINTKRVKLVRHQDTRSPGRPTPYILWQIDKSKLELYQRIQTNRVFSIRDVLATFVVTPTGETLFAGLYCVAGVGVAPNGLMDPIGNFDVGGRNLYDIRPDKRLEEYEGHLIVEWGKAYRVWIQRALRQDKKVLEIRRELLDPPFPGFTRFTCDISHIAAIPQSWRAVLQSVKGVYLLVCKETGKQYIGSAKGQENLWGRFLDYATTGHGGNVELRRRGPKQYQVSVLEIVNSDTEIEMMEAAWKQKLLTRQFGLNEN
jgi:hypothetical protein